jgi:hypothetical protein
VLGRSSSRANNLDLLTQIPPIHCLPLLQMPVHLANHPVELLCRIFIHLDVLDLYHCCLVSMPINRSIKLQFEQFGRRAVSFEPLSMTLPNFSSNSNLELTAWFVFSLLLRSL